MCMEGGVSGDRGVPAMERKERRKEQDNVTMEGKYVLGLQVRNLFVQQVISLNFAYIDLAVMGVRAHNYRLNTDYNASVPT